MVDRLSEVRYEYIYISILMAMLSHFFRAYRWNLMLWPIGFRLRTLRTLLAVMVGYFANLLVPRMGEVTRCGVLKKTDNVPMTASLGSVVAERMVDLVVLILMVIAAFIIEFDKLQGFMGGIYDSNAAFISQNILTVLIVVGSLIIILLIVFLLIRRHKETLKKYTFFLKIRQWLREIVDGISSITKVEKVWQFVFATLAIWILYYTMSYIVVFALPETDSLDLLAGLSLLAMGSIGMAAPVQGGFGTYHALVAGVLVLYGINEEDGVLFATLLHTSQVIFILVVGGISFIISLLINKKDARHEKTLKNNRDEIKEQGNGKESL